MSTNYKPELKKLVSNKKKEIPTSISDNALKNIFEILRSTPHELFLISDIIRESDFNKPVISGKRSFRETLIHFLNVEAMNYTAVYPALLLDKPNIYPLHAERDIKRLSLFDNFFRPELLLAFELERRKTLNFFSSLSPDHWSREIVEVNKTRKESIYWRARELALHDFTHIMILKFQQDLI